jgi:hypothetical protein
MGIAIASNAHGPAALTIVSGDRKRLPPDAPLPRTRLTRRFVSSNNDKSKKQRGERTGVPLISAHGCSRRTTERARRRLKHGAYDANGRGRAASDDVGPRRQERAHLGGYGVFPRESAGAVGPTGLLLLQGPPSSDGGLCKGGVSVSVLGL